MPLVDIDPVITRAAYLDSRVRLTERTWSNLIAWSHDANRRPERGAHQVVGVPHPRLCDAVQ